MISLGGLYNSSLVHGISVYLILSKEFLMPTLQIEIITMICRKQYYLQLIRSQQSGQPDKNTDWSRCIHRTNLTGLIAQSYTQKRSANPNKTQTNSNIALPNHIKRKMENPDEDLLQLFWTTEGELQ